MKKQKRVLSAALASVLCLSLAAGCSGGQPGQGGSSDSGSQAQNNAEMEGNLYLTGLPIVKEPVQYTVMLSKSALDKTSSFADKEILKEAEQQTNVQFEWMEVPASGWTDRVNIVFASGDLPDVILGEVDVVANERALTEITDEMLQKYMPNLYAYMESEPLVRTKVTTPEGKMYSLPSGENTASWNRLQDALYINTEWLGKLGLEKPTTTKEFYEALVACKEAGDLNGNGVVDEIPFGFCELEKDMGLRSMFGPWGVINTVNYTNVRDGQVFFAPQDPGFYEGLKYLHTLFSEGLMDPEGFSQPRAQYNSKTLSDPPVYFVVAASTIGNAVAPSQVDNYEHLLPLKGPDGTQLTRGYSQASNMKNKHVTITRNCEDPAPFMRWLDWHMSDASHFFTWQHGEENVGWKWVGDPADKTWSRIIDPPAPGYNNNDEYRFTYGFMGETALTNVFDKTYTRDLSNDSLTQRKAETALAYDPFYEKEVVFTDLLQSAETTKEVTLLFADIDTYMKSFVATSVSSGITDAQWEEHLAQLQKLRVDEYVALYQQMYDNQISQ